MTTDQPAIDRIPVARSVVYVVRGVPEIADEYNADRTIAPTEISFTYQATEDSHLGRVHAYVKGWWMQDGVRIPTDKPVGRHFWGRAFENWPDWLAEEARLHDPAAVSAVPARADLLTAADQQFLSFALGTDPTVEPLATYSTDGYSDLDRRAALALRTPLLALLHTVPAGDRAQWLASLVGGLQHGVTQGVAPDPGSDAYKTGQRMSLLITEEGHA
ncbi:MULTISPECIES: hypothetical protein [unclassified Streptomyces]|uniref:hypothetical protein n=1 Tax=unclassified Streptomyces TaxID=2593676 RepID=UPI00224F921E|nr:MULTISPECIES: hypothetical protein [unclassified Streptomyces]MCX4405929.1 hypothetical protein [Streptomyces sp. NBC_01764]MCX5189547.1 hypothetical protein [Streptomyces sp. NBC_00268]